MHSIMDSRRRVAIGNAPLVSKVAAAAVVRYMAQKRLERCFSHPPCADSNLPAGNPYCTHRRIGGVVVGIERFVLPACADLACLTSQMRLGESPFERSQEFIRSTARPVRQRCSIPRGMGVLVRALGGGDRG